MEVVVRTEVKSSHYRKLIQVLNDMLQDPRSVYVMEELKLYMRSSALAGESARPALPDSKGRMYSTGRRKTSVARVWVGPGSGRILVNKSSLIDYFPRVCNDPRCRLIFSLLPLIEPSVQLSDRQAVLAPFLVTETAGSYDVYATVKGGGTTGMIFCMAV
jgi:ribosomal protein S9